MKILAINASHSGSKGHTHFLINLLFAGAQEAGAEVEVVSLANLKINRCLACRQCQTNEHFLQCVWSGKDDVSSVFQKMAAADLIIYATPIYVFNMSGLLKLLLDRLYGTSDCADLRLTRSGLMFHTVDRAICSKPFVLLTCCDNLENETPKNVIAYFRSFSKFMDAPQVGLLVRNAGQLSGHGADPEREKLFPRIRAVHAAYHQAGRELAQTGRIHPSTQRRANQEIIPLPFFHLLKRLPLKSLKRMFVEKAREMQQQLQAERTMPAE